MGRNRNENAVARPVAGAGEGKYQLVATPPCPLTTHPPPGPGRGPPHGEGKSQFAATIVLNTLTGTLLSLSLPPFAFASLYER